MKYLRKIILLTGLTLAGLALYQCNAYDLLGKMYPEEAAATKQLKVFVSSVVTMGDMSAFAANFASCSIPTGIQRANCACNAMAANAGLSGVYSAWLSTTSTAPGTDALCNIVGKQGTTVGGSGCGGFKASDATYVDVNYNPVFHNWDDIKAGANPMRIINMTEMKTTLNPGVMPVWTGTYTGGMGSPNNCTDWTFPGGTGPTGDAGDFNTILGWSLNVGGQSCAALYPIYCFEQP